MTKTEWRDKTVGFKASTEEHAIIEAMAKRFMFTSVADLVRTALRNELTKLTGNQNGCLDRKFPEL